MNESIKDQLEAEVEAHNVLGAEIAQANVELQQPNPALTLL